MTRLPGAPPSDAHGDEVRAKIRDAAQFSAPFATMNALATVVACYGLFADSTAVVIGAMVIAMLLGPITGIALALVEGDAALFRRALAAEVGGAVMVFAIAYLLGKVHFDLPLTAEIRARTQPNLLDLIIALAGGAAGAYAQVSPRLSTGMVGVAIATALVPPLSTAGICAARGAYAPAGAAFVLFLTNLAAIEIISAVVLWLHGFHRPSTQTLESPMDRRSQLLRNAVSALILLALTAFLAANFGRTLDQQRFERQTRARLSTSLAGYPGARLADLSITRKEALTVVNAVVRTPKPLTPAQVRVLERDLPAPPGGKVDLHLISVLIQEAVRDGYLHQLPEGVRAEFQEDLPAAGLSAAAATKP